MTSLMEAMHLWELCIEVRGDSWGDERCNVLLLVVLLVLDAEEGLLM